MSRKKRIHYNEALYHVMLRGNYRQDIFSCKSHYEYFYHLLSKVVTQFNCKIHLFCLMTNHIHLVIEVNKIPLWKIMQSLLTSYAKYNHKTTNRMGHLFQGRYKAKIIENDHYLLELCYYIHLNPLKAKMVDDIDLYRWSSHLTYMGIEPWDWVTTNFVCSAIEKHSKNQKIYQEFIKNKIFEAKFCEFDEAGILIVKSSINEKIISKKPVFLGNLTIIQIAEVICNYMKVNLEDLKSLNLSKELSYCRSLITYFAHYQGNHHLVEIAYFFMRQPDSLSKTLTRHLNDPDLKKKFEENTRAIDYVFSSHVSYSKLMNA